ncbi:MAG: hypothetical protein RIR86_573 [Acidobacteriota bacterium]|jgi:hypothetical protein
MDWQGGVLSYNIKFACLARFLALKATGLTVAKTARKVKEDQSQSILTGSEPFLSGKQTGWSPVVQSNYK